MKILLLNSFLLLLIFSNFSCSNFRVFQQKVPQPIKKNYKHLDYEKQAGYYLATNVNEPNKSIANALSNSLGLPSKLESNSAQITDNLIASSNAYESEITGLNSKLENLQGKQIDGTGLNLFPISSILGIIGIVAVCILFPSAITILFFILKRTRKAFENVVSGVKEFTEKNPNESKGLDEILEKKLDRVEKKLKWKYEGNG